MNDRLLKLAKAIADKKKADTDKVEAIKAKWAGKAKAKALTTAERLDRIEELLGLKDAQ